MESCILYLAVAPKRDNTQTGVALKRENTHNIKCQLEKAKISWFILI